jgi:hypothetical protein
MTFLLLWLAGRNSDTPFVAIGAGVADLYGDSLVPENTARAN